MKLNITRVNIQNSPLQQLCAATSASTVLCNSNIRKIMRPEVNNKQTISQWSRSYSQQLLVPTYDHDALPWCRLSCLLSGDFVSLSGCKIATKPTILFWAKDRRVNCKMMPLSQHWHHCHCFPVSWWYKPPSISKYHPKSIIYLVTFHQTKRMVHWVRQLVTSDLLTWHIYSVLCLCCFVLTGLTRWSGSWW